MVNIVKRTADGLPLFFNELGFPLLNRRSNSLLDLLRMDFENQEENQGFNVDIKKDQEKLMVSAELPGAKKEDIKVELNDGVLSISVTENTENKTKEGETLIVSERIFKKRARFFTITETIDEENIKAEYKDGILNLILPKKEISTTTKLIEIK